MVLDVDTFRLHTSLKKTLKKFRTTPGCEIRMDFAFESVLRACSESDRPGQDGNYCSGMIAAYCELHRAGLAHSVEIWSTENRWAGAVLRGTRASGVFGESMFTFATDALR